jgi:hypothetical protein
MYANLSRAITTHPVNFDCSTLVNSKPSLESLIELAQNLPIDERAELVQKLLGQNSALSVVFGNNQLSGQIIVQINTTDRESLGDILDAIANRIRAEKDQS